MKKTLLTILASGIVLIAYGQDPTPPKEVQSAFSKIFAAASEIEWDQEDNEWEAEFELNGNETTACFDNSGSWLETETEVKKKDVPAEIYKAVVLKFNGWEIKEIVRIENTGFKGYELELKEEDTRTEVLVTDAGELTITKVKVKD